MELEKEIHQTVFRNEAQKAGINLIFTFNWLSAKFDELFKQKGITSQQFNVLRILRGQYPNSVTVKVIRERMLDKMSDASRIVEKLRVKGYLDRKVDSDDRRACQVTITQKGLDLLADFQKLEFHFDEPFENLTPDEIKQLNYLLDKLRG